MSSAGLRQLGLVAEHVVDPRVGVLHSLQPLEAPAGSPSFFHYSAQLCNLQACGWQGNFARIEGSGTTRDRAAAKALREALALYAAAFYRRDELPLSSVEEAPWPCAAPESFALFSPEQYGLSSFPFVPFTLRTRVRWVPATRLRTGEPCHVPAAAVRLPYAVEPGEDEAPIQPATAAGLACDFQAAAAAIAALCSLVRDDALAIAWHGRLAPPQIRIETLSDECYGLVERFEGAGGDVTAFDLTSDLGVPVILLALRCLGPDAPALLFAAGADPDPEHAVREALEELSLVLRYCREIKTHRATGEPAPGPAEHLRFWSDASNATRAGFLFSSHQRVEFDEIQGLVGGGPGPTRDQLAGRIEEAGYRVLLADITSSDLASLGIHVVRAVVPGLVPLFAGTDRQALGGRRLAEIPALLGLPQSEAGEPLPHPFLCKGIVA